MTKKQKTELRDNLIRCRRTYAARGAQPSAVAHLDSRTPGIANPKAIKAAMDALNVELDRQIEELGGDPERSGLNEVVRDWMLRVHPGERDWMEDFSETVTFLELARRMRDGENFYEIVDCGESEQRQRCFERLAELTDTDYDVWYGLWLAAGPHENAKERKADEAKRKALAAEVDKALKAKGCDPKG